MRGENDIISVGQTIKEPLFALLGLNGRHFELFFFCSTYQQLKGGWKARPNIPEAMSHLSYSHVLTSRVPVKVSD